jgi:hypothetical protein
LQNIRRALAVFVLSKVSRMQKTVSIPTKMPSGCRVVSTRVHNESMKSESMLYSIEVLQPNIETMQQARAMKHFWKIYRDSD